MAKAIVFEAARIGYSIDQIERRAMTVGDLKAFLEEFDDDTYFILSHDNGYTYGSVDERDCREVEYNEETEEWEEVE